MHEQKMSPKNNLLLQYSLVGNRFLDGHKAALFINEGDADLLVYKNFLQLPTVFVSNSHFSLKLLTR